VSTIAPPGLLELAGRRRLTMTAERETESPGERLIDLLGGGQPGRAALVNAETGESLTYAGLAQAVGSLAGRLGTLGVRRGSRVALVVPDGPDFLQLLLAVISLGATAAPLNPAYKRDEYEFYLEDLRPELLLIPAGELPAAREAVAGTVQVVDVVHEGATIELHAGEGRVERETPYEPADPDDVALLLHTSGTTSRPKQVPLRQRNLMVSARTIAAFYDLGPEDVSYCAMPLFHVHGLVASTFGALAGGGTVVAPRRFVPRAFWPQLRSYGVTWFSAGPTLHGMILDRIDADGAPGTLRFARSCSSALAPALMQRIEEALGAPVVEAYGMTEASHQMASNPLPPAARKPGSVGVPSGVEIRIVDPQGQTLAQGASGEIAIKGPGVTDGYLSNPEANEDSFFDGWFRTGDRGSFDEDGYLRLEGRLKEMILRGGENISPYEIEEVLLGHPAVADAICFGIDDEKYGERVGVAVALSGDAGVRELIDYCRERLAAFKVPEVVHVLDAIPRTATGKVQRKRVGATLSEGAG
jgi:acyl-CoA synthetase (AMP-forming)/AMP-acid ligase II